MPQKHSKNKYSEMSNILSSKIQSNVPCTRAKCINILYSSFCVDYLHQPIFFFETYCLKIYDCYI